MIPPRNVLPRNRRDVPSPIQVPYEGGDHVSAKEDEAIAADIDLEQRTNTHRRRERFRDLFWSGTQWFVRTIIFVTILIVLVVAWHYVMPTGWGWLTEDQLGHLRTFIFSGAVISAVSSHIQRYG